RHLRRDQTALQHGVWETQIKLIGCVTEIENCPEKRLNRQKRMLTMRKRVPAALIGSLLLATIACTKSAPRREEPVVEGDRLVHLSANPPKNFVHQTFQVQSYKS